MESIILSKLLEAETLRGGVYLLMLFCFYLVVLRKPIHETLTKMTTFNERTESMNKVLKIMLYKTLKDMFSDAVRHEGKTYEEDEEFKTLWENYVVLGDGHGDELYKKWQALKFIINGADNE